MQCLHRLSTPLPKNRHGSNTQVAELFQSVALGAGGEVGIYDRFVSCKSLYIMQT